MGKVGGRWADKGIRRSEHQVAGEQDSRESGDTAGLRASRGKRR